jgi:4-hydroxy-2-oxoglutarate aldolase
MSATNGNGHAASSRTLKPGVWAPIPSFFNQDESLGESSFRLRSRTRHRRRTDEADIPTFKSHVARLAKSGMQPVVCGSMGEAHHLSDDERVQLFTEARAALDAAGCSDTVLIAGT